MRSARNEYGGLKGDQVKRLNELEIENNRLRRASRSDCTKLIQSEPAKGNISALPPPRKTSRPGIGPAPIDAARDFNHPIDEAVLSADIV
jgi:hypothetical protein